MTPFITSRGPILKECTRLVGGQLALETVTNIYFVVLSHLKKKVHSTYK